MAELIARLTPYLPLVLLAAAGWVLFGDKLKATFAGGIPAMGTKPKDDFLHTVDAARDLINHLDAAGDEEGATSARKAAARLFEPEAKAK
jgi:hypothetical protein